MAEPSTLRRAAGSLDPGSARLLRFSLLGGRGFPQLLRHRLGQLHGQRRAHRKRCITAANHGVRQRRSRLLFEGFHGLVGAVDDAADHPAVAVDPDEAHRTGGGADHLAAPRAVLDADFGRVVAQRIGELTGHFTPQAARLRRGVGGDGEAAVGRDDPHGARDPGLGQLDLQLARLRHGNEHRAQVQARQLGDRRVVEIVDVERTLEFFDLVGSPVAGRCHDVVRRADVLAGRADGRFFAVVIA